MRQTCSGNSPSPRARVSFLGRLLAETGKNRHTFHQLGFEPGPDIEGMVCYSSGIAIFELLFQLNDATIQLEVF